MNLQTTGIFLFNVFFMSFYRKLKCKTILLLNYLFQILYEYVVCFNKLP